MHLTSSKIYLMLAEPIVYLALNTSIIRITQIVKGLPDINN